MGDFDDEHAETAEETGSDELLSDDNLRLPDSASTLVRLHAVRSWLTRRQLETQLELGEAALMLQQAQQEPEVRPRRRAREVRQPERMLNEAQQRLSAYEEAQALLEECVTHTTSGERVLVEYYLTLEEVMEAGEQERPEPWLHALADVQSRVERVGMPNEE